MINQQTGAAGQHLLDPPKHSDYFNEAINVPDFPVRMSDLDKCCHSSKCEDTSNGCNKQRHMIEIKDAFVGFKPSPLPPPPDWHYHRLPA